MLPSRAIAPLALTFTLVYQKKATVTANSFTKLYDGTALTMPTVLADQVTVDGLLDGDSLTGVTLGYANVDNATNDGRLNAGVATVTPSAATISGKGANPNYYKVRYINGTLEVTKINVTIRIEPDRWTGNVYDGTEYKTGFTNGKKTVADYIMISDPGYATAYLDTIWNTIKGLSNVKAGGAGLGYYVEAQTNAGDYEYVLDFTPADLPQNDNYSVNLFVRSGRLQILPKEITVTTGSDTKAYDGAVCKSSA